VTYELEGSTLRLFLTTELKAREEGIRPVLQANNTETYCLQRFNASCILYLHTVHSNRSTTFFVVFACMQRITS